MGADDKIIPLAMGLHFSNIILIYILMLLFFHAIGVEGAFAYVFGTLVYMVFMWKEFMFFRSQAKHVPLDAERALKSEYSLQKLRKLAKKTS